MKTYKIKGQLVVDCEWTVQVNDDQNVDDAWTKIVEDGCFLEEPTGDVERKLLDVDRYDESSIYLTWSSENGDEDEYLFGWSNGDYSLKEHTDE